MTASESSYRALFAVPSIPRIVAGMTMGRLAGSMVSIAAILFSLALYNSPLVTGLVTFASIFPGTVASPLAGALLDRYGRTRMVILDYLIAAASLILIGILATLDALPPWLLIVIIGVSSLTHPLSNSGLRSLFPIIVPRHLWNRANAIDSNSYVVSQLIGPPLAGVAIQALGPIVGLVVVGSVYALAAVATLGIPEPTVEQATTGRLMTDARAGVMYVLRNRTLRGLAISMSTMRIGSGVQAIVLPVVVIEVLHEGPAMVGLAWGLAAVGGFVAALLFGRVETAGRERQMLAACWAGTALGPRAAAAGHDAAARLRRDADHRRAQRPGRRDDVLTPAAPHRLRVARPGVRRFGSVQLRGLPDRQRDRRRRRRRRRSRPLCCSRSECACLGGLLAWLLIPQHDEPLRT